MGVFALKPVRFGAGGRAAVRQWPSRGSSESGLFYNILIWSAQDFGAFPSSSILVPGTGYVWYQPTVLPTAALA